MAFYECVFLTRPELSTAQIDTLVENYTNIISENGGSVGKTEYWGLRSLPFRVKKNRKAHFTLMNLDTDGTTLKEIERQMRLSEDVIRFMSVGVEELEEGPSAVLRAKAAGRDRAERSERGGDRGYRPRPSAAQNDTISEEGAN